ncbi:MAG: hypothetical protein Q8P81_04395 [Nanoarchaeota archaeon]|nr:hypothetical protein [Nanoarchaeota archaeon]
MAQEPQVIRNTAGLEVKLYWDHAEVLSPTGEVVTTVYGEYTEVTAPTGRGYELGARITPGHSLHLEAFRTVGGPVQEETGQTTMDESDRVKIDDLGNICREDENSP